MFYFLSSGPCGDTAFPRIQLKKLAEILIQSGQRTLKTVKPQTDTI